MSKRYKNHQWVVTFADAKLAVLMDIRDELKTLNRLLACPNFLQIPTSLREISAHTKPRKRKPKNR